MSDCEQILPLQEEAQLAHNTKLHKSPPGCGCHLLFKQGSVWANANSSTTKEDKSLNLQPPNQKPLSLTNIEPQSVVPHPVPYSLQILG